VNGFFKKRRIKGRIQSQHVGFPLNLVGLGCQNYSWQQSIAEEVGITE